MKGLWSRRAWHPTVESGAIFSVSQTCLRHRQRHRHRHFLHSLSEVQAPGDSAKEGWCKRQQGPLCKLLPVPVEWKHMSTAARGHTPPQRMETFFRTQDRVFFVHWFPMEITAWHIAV